MTPHHHFETTKVFRFGGPLADLISSLMMQSAPDVLTLSTLPPFEAARLAARELQEAAYETLPNKPGPKTTPDRMINLNRIGRTYFFMATSYQGPCERDMNNFLSFGTKSKPCGIVLFDRCDGLVGILQRPVNRP